MKNACAVLVCFLSLVACNQNSDVQLSSIVLHDTEGKEVSIGNLSGNKILVLTFLSPDCPLCLNYTTTLQNIRQQFSVDEIGFVAVFPGKDYDTESIKDFLDDYSPGMQGVLDPEFLLTRAVKATVTPEAVVISRDGKIVYSGSIDNRSYAIGKKRTLITNHYLRNALEKVLHDSLPDPDRTEPIGCFIEI